MGTLVTKSPTLAILDNVETPWHAEPNETEKMLGHLAGLSGLRLVLTVRGETPRVAGGTVMLDDVERLKPEDAKTLFLREARNRFATDPALPTLLAALDGHPLSIVLMAAQTDGRSDLAALARDWDKRRAAVLARGPANDRLTSVRTLPPRTGQLHRAPRRDRVRALRRRHRPRALRGGKAPLRARREPPRTGRLGDIALGRSDHGTASARYEEARPLYERVGDLLGQANCIQSLGDIALARSEHVTARARFEEAKPLCEHVGDLLGQANCIKRFGDIALRRSEHVTARTRYEEALSLYAGIPEPYSIGLTHLALTRVAANDADRERHRAAARAAWASIGRQDLIAEHLDASLT